MEKYRFDLHIHSRYSSDGLIEPAKIIEIARQRNLDGVAVTDHNTIRGGMEAKKFETADFKVIVGSEINTDMGEVIGLFLSEEIRSKHLMDVINEIKEQGGIIVVPHPFDRLRKVSFPITDRYAGYVNAIEAFNSRCVFDSYNKEAREFARTNGLTPVGGSDAHFANEIGLAGIITSSPDIKGAILKGDVEIFGRRSSVLNHVGTKLRKIRGKIFK
jgi:predicted metal-dependent phosphoesterase TrpH